MHVEQKIRYCGRAQKTRFHVGSGGAARFRLRPNSNESERRRVCLGVWGSFQPWEEHLHGCFWYEWVDRQGPFIDSPWRMTFKGLAH